MQDWGFIRLFESQQTLDPYTIAAYAVAMAEKTDIPAGLPAGYTYFSQFVTHDLSDLRRSTKRPRRTPADISKLVQLRKPALDLDSLYGGGLYDSTVVYLKHNGKFKLGQAADGSYNDLYRRPDGRALIADPRNDENLLVAQMHLLFMRFHNALVKFFLHQGGRQLSGSELFDKARQEAIASYRWVVLHDLSRNLVPDAVYQSIIVDGQGRLMPGAPTPEMSVEFAGAAFRLGHSMVLDSYQLTGRSGGKATLKMLFELTGKGTIDDASPLPEEKIVDWSQFFKFGSYLDYGPSDKIVPNMAHRIDASITRGLLSAHSGDIVRADLLRGVELGLATGQEIYAALERTHPHVARRLGLADIDVGDVFRNLHPDYRHTTPLWTYVLAEAELHNPTGQPGIGRLGPLGGWLVADGLLAAAEYSAGQVPQGWTPSCSVVSQYVRDIKNEEPDTTEKLSIEDIIVFTIESEQAAMKRMQRKCYGETAMDKNSDTQDRGLITQLTVLLDQLFVGRDHKYKDWLGITAADDVGLLHDVNGTWETVEYPDWPEDFKRYLPEKIEDDSYIVLTAPGWNEDGVDCVVVYLGNVWAPAIRKDLFPCRLTGVGDRNVGEQVNRRSHMNTDVWNLLRLDVETNAQGDRRTAKLTFRHQDGERYAALWGWPPPS